MYPVVLYGFYSYGCFLYPLFYLQIILLAVNANAGDSSIRDKNAWTQCFSKIVRTRGLSLKIR